MWRWREFCGLWFVALAVQGCASYHAEPLPTDAELLHDLTMTPVAGAGTTVVDLSDGIDPDEAAVLAVLDNPDLRAARARAGVAAAQLFAAGLFPDPQVVAGYDEPTSSGPGLARGYTFSVAADVAAMLTRGASRDAALASDKQARLDLLWQELQVAEQARLTAARFGFEQRKLTILAAARGRLEADSSAAADALQRGDITVDGAASYRAALLDAASTQYQVQLQHNATAHALNALFGLAPDVELAIAPVVPVATWPAIDMTEVAAQRPDLLALAAGYQSQEARVRQAVWAQFPVINLAWDRLRDTSNVWSSGFNVVLNLPLFSGGRGEIAVQRATRAQLREEYRSRLAQSAADLARLRADGTILQTHEQFLQRELPDLETMVVQAERGARSGDLAVIAATNLRATLTARQLELIDVEQSLCETHIALDTLTGRVSR